MKVPNFKLKPGKDHEGKETKAMTDQENLANIFSYAIGEHYSKEKSVNGSMQTVSTLSGSQGRMWGRIQLKLDDAIDSKSKSVSLDDSETDFLSGAIESTEFPIGYFRWTVLVQDALSEKTK